MAALGSATACDLPTHGVLTREVEGLSSLNIDCSLFALNPSIPKMGETGEFLPHFLAHGRGGEPEN